MIYIVETSAFSERQPAMLTRDKIPSVCPPVACGGMGEVSRDLEPHQIRRLAPLRPSLGDAISRRLAKMLHLHPEIDREYVGVDLRKLSSEGRRKMLADIEARLGIQQS